MHGTAVAAMDPTTLSCTDAVTWHRSLPAESVDLIITDPPYESLEKHRAVREIYREQLSLLVDQKLAHLAPGFGLAVDRTAGADRNALERLVPLKNPLR